MSYPGDPPPYSGPQRGMPMVQLQPLPGQNVIPSVVPVIVGQPMGTGPSMIVCKSCHYQIFTRVEARPSLKTHVWAVCLCVLGFWPCAWIPYCMPVCMNVDHYCPNCNAYIGNYQH